jgi:hypothetical protein
MRNLIHLSALFSMQNTDKVKQTSNLKEPSDENHLSNYAFHFHKHICPDCTLVDPDPFTANYNRFIALS